MTDLQTIQIEGFPFKYPKNLEGCVRGVLEGEYAFPKLPDAPPIKRILDLGANVGAFAIWAHAQWPEATISCVEPHPETFELLKENVDHLGNLVHCVNAAVTAKHEGPVFLYEGRDWGYNSLQPGLNPKTGKRFEVVSVWADLLGAADVVKIDIEGDEFNVWRMYSHRASVYACLYEWHRVEDRTALDLLLRHEDFRLFRTDQPLDCLGRALWARSRATFDKETGKYVLPPEKESPTLAPSKAEGFGA